MSHDLLVHDRLQDWILSDPLFVVNNPCQVGMLPQDMHADCLLALATDLCSGWKFKLDAVGSRGSRVDAHDGDIRRYTSRIPTRLDSNSLNR